MHWWVYVAAIAVVFVAVDWIIVMGADPRKWKGGKSDDHGKRPDQ